MVYLNIKCSNCGKVSLLFEKETNYCPKCLKAIEEKDITKRIDSKKNYFDIRSLYGIHA